MDKILCPNAISPNFNYNFVLWLIWNGKFYIGEINIPKSGNWYSDDYAELKKLCNANKILEKKLKLNGRNYQICQMPDKISALI
ncbi:hypothetical protein A3Q56_05252 [Intoshia linei]|uniref:Uncharacterized protein n=1 Tax=Intoshia linei TaxID=1819745 RepID=A0A177AYD7_9BILA|nr:hypothetical protein A3Q56_05252 [Intoshia linei]